ncbi:LacI family DNA-binding transcriptional regulator [Frondihabitans australicus]|uniref:LacI family transcriptional regulator n=1 Tax=Frondihabitans australicus TaxID=386892 RepID=A0A495IMQ5_9MICO|nr:LacI family DNA-binding transcriptional regulator [Frondihabitans australicus]RKR76481.1 LacI family transcriptional regulator [Frondihabitans australicus]
MAARRVTIDEVADAAGVSRQTVSNVLRGTGRVGSATAARIQEVVDRLGYAPHPGASSMRSKRSGQLAYPLMETSLAPDNVIVMDFMRSLIGAAGEQGYHVLVTSTGAAGMRDLVRSGRVDGFVFNDMFGYDERLAIVEETHTPFAAFGRVPDGLRQAWVDVDNVAGTHRTTEHMIALGHRDILYLGYEPSAYWDDERRSGYLTSMREHGLPARVLESPGDHVDMTEAVSRLLRPAAGSAAVRPTAIVCSSDLLSVSVYRAAAAVGLAVGPELSVSGFDSSVIGRSLVPTLTSLKVPVSTIAHIVVERFVREVQDPTAAVEGRLVVPELVLGDSTAPPAR